MPDNGRIIDLCWRNVEKVFDDPDGRAVDPIRAGHIRVYFWRTPIDRAPIEIEAGMFTRPRSSDAPHKGDKGHPDCNPRHARSRHRSISKEEKKNRSPCRKPLVIISIDGLFTKTVGLFQDQSSETIAINASIILLYSLLPVSGSEPGPFPVSSWSVPAIDDRPAASWRGHAFLESPGGNLYFGLDVQFSRLGAREGVRAWIFNGKQRDEVPAEVHVPSTVSGHTGLNSGRLTLRFDQYDSEITADIKAGAIVRLDGQWRKRRSRDEWATLPFHATFTEAKDFGSRAPSESDAARIAGRWAATFGPQSNPAIGVFEALPEHTLAGTFLTPSGDYGFLSGWFREDRLYLSSFDGAHALLFRASVQPEGTLAGDFWAGDSHHETWTARRDPDASLPDAFTHTQVSGRANLADMVFPDVNGNRLALTDAKLAGKARLIQIFGTWCPNCHDEAAFLSELDVRYRDRGLSIVGLAFELTGDVERDARQVQRYAERHQIKYPLLIAGTRERAKAAEAFPLLERISAYPTTVFLHADGRVRAVHTGFSGPAAPEEHRRLRKQFESIIEELLSE